MRHERIIFQYIVVKSKHEGACEKSWALFLCLKIKE
nr:MAG TPA_asm: hypothetical protein [Caudoviricetes sp.]